VVKPYISKIENYNSKAMRILLGEGYGSTKSRRLLADNAKSLRYGFVIARDNWPEYPLYRDPRVKLHVLTEERLLATLQNKIPPSPPPDPDKVNSIFRPTLPDGKIWEIRSPW
jgi:hypothetical protein